MRVRAGLTSLLLLWAASAAAATHWVCFTAGTGACTSQAACSGLTSTDCSDACTAGNNAQIGSGTVGPWCNLPGQRNATNTAFIGPSAVVVAGSTIKLKRGTIKTGGDGQILIDSTHYQNGSEAAPTTIDAPFNWGTGQYATIDGTGMTVPAFDGLISNSKITYVHWNNLEVLNAGQDALHMSCNGCQGTNLPDGTTGFWFTFGRIDAPVNSAIWLETTSTYPMMALVQSSSISNQGIGGVVVWKSAAGYALVYGNTIDHGAGGGNTADMIQFGGGSLNAVTHYSAAISNIVKNSLNDGIDVGGHACHDHYLVEDNDHFDNVGSVKVHGNQQSDCGTKNDTFNIVRYNRITNDEVSEYSYPNDTVWYNNTIYNGRHQIFTDCLPNPPACGSAAPWPQAIGTASYGTGPGSGDRDFGRHTMKNNLMWRNPTGPVVFINGGVGFRQSVRNADIRWFSNIWNTSGSSRFADWWPDNTVGPSPAGLASYGTMNAWAAITPDAPSVGGMDKTGDTDASMFVDATTKNYHLPVGSTARDAGTWLTRAVGAGVASTSLTVERASYFHDSWDPDDRCTGVNAPYQCCTGVATGTCATTTPLLTADTIMLGNQGPLGILRVNDTTNVITLTAPATWADGALVNPGRVTDFVPDIGAFEEAPVTTTSTSTSSTSSTSSTTSTTAQPAVLCLSCQCLSCKMGSN